MVYPGMETCDSAFSSVTFIEINFNRHFTRIGEGHEKVVSMH